MGTDLATDVRTLLDERGTTFAHEAGIRLADQPAPLYQLLVLSVLLSTRIRAEIAIAATRELLRAGFGTPQRMRDSDWQARVDALGRAHYVRYDESTATALGQGAQLVLDRYRGGLRRLRREADGDPRALSRALQATPRLGPTGAAIFCREVQAVWPEYRPYLDDRALAGARQRGLPDDPERLAAQVTDEEIAELAAALVRAVLR